MNKCIYRYYTLSKLLSVLYIKQILHVTMCANVFHVTLKTSITVNSLQLRRIMNFHVYMQLQILRDKNPNLFDQTIKQNYLTNIVLI